MELAVLVGVALLLGIGFFAWLRGGRGQTRTAQTKNPQRPEITITAGVESFYEEPEYYREYPFEIVGESHYQDTLKEIVENSDDPGPNWPFKGAQCKVWAQLVFEDSNPYDPMAVRVDVEGHTVGYFSRADARRCRAVLDAPLPLPALIVGGWDHGERGNRPGYDKPKGSFGVRLAFEIKD